MLDEYVSRQLNEVIEKLNILEDKVNQILIVTNLPENLVQIPNELKNFEKEKIEETIKSLNRQVLNSFSVPRKSNMKLSQKLAFSTKEVLDE
ncbi:MAG: hypothetical protein FWF50_00225 [Defluviitaleaceae bacterium]|nr:hypothetical protein [Defluviitaleaceae bacterium]